MDLACVVHKTVMKNTVVRRIVVEINAIPVVCDVVAIHSVVRSIVEINAILVVCDVVAR